MINMLKAHIDLSDWLDINSRLTSKALYSVKMLG